MCLLIDVSCIDITHGDSSFELDYLVYRHGL